MKSGYFHKSLGSDVLTMTKIVKVLKYQAGLPSDVINGLNFARPDLVIVTENPGKVLKC